VRAPLIDVVSGRLTIQLRDRDVELSAGDTGDITAEPVRIWVPSSAMPDAVRHPLFARFYAWLAPS
jgi:hypothetical protein